MLISLIFSFLYLAPKALLIGAAILPAIILLVYVYRHDRIEKEPRKLLLTLVLLGVVATFLIFFLIGVWHVANWNAVIYGTYFGLMLSLALLMEPLFKWLRTRLHINAKAWWWKAVSLVRTWVLVLLPQYFAYTTSPAQAVKQIGLTFRSWDFSDAAVRMTRMTEPLEWYIALIAMVIVLLIDLLCERGVDVNGRLARTTVLLRWPVLIGLIVAILVFGCYGSGFDASAFLYTQF